MDLVGIYWDLYGESALDRINVILKYDSGSLIRLVHTLKWPDSLLSSKRSFYALLFKMLHCFRRMATQLIYVWHDDWIIVQVIITILITIIINNIMCSLSVFFVYGFNDAYGKAGRYIDNKE